MCVCVCVRVPGGRVEDRTFRDQDWNAVVIVEAVGYAGVESYRIWDSQYQYHSALSWRGLQYQVLTDEYVH